jgi:hypothetical protein
VINFRPISLLNNVFQLYEFIIHDNVLHYVNLIPITWFHQNYQFGDILDLVTPVVSGQLQVDAIYYDLSNSFNLIPHSRLFHKFGYLYSLIFMLAGFVNT